MITHRFKLDQMIEPYDTFDNAADTLFYILEWGSMFQHQFVDGKQV